MNKRWSKVFLLLIYILLVTPCLVQARFPPKFVLIEEQSQAPVSSCDWQPVVQLGSYDFRWADINRDSTLIIAGGIASDFTLWSAHGTKLRTFIIPETTIGYIKTGAFTPDGKQIVTVDTSAVRYWDIQGHQIKKLSFPSEKNGTAHLIDEACLTPDGRFAFLVVGGGEVYEKWMYIFDTAESTLTPIFTHKGKDLVKDVTISRDGSRMAFLTSKYAYVITGSGDVACKISNKDESSEISLNSSGTTIMMGGYIGSKPFEGKTVFRQFRISDGECTLSFDHTERVQGSLEAVSAYSPDDRRFVTCGIGQLVVHDNQGSIIGKSPNSGSAVMFSDDGTMILSVDRGAIAILKPNCEIINSFHKGAEAKNRLRGQRPEDRGQKESVLQGAFHLLSVWRYAVVEGYDWKSTGRRLVMVGKTLSGQASPGWSTAGNCA